MPPLLIAAGAYGLLLAGVGFVCWIAGGSDSGQQQTKDLALKRIAALAEERGKWITFHLTNGKMASGRLVHIDPETLIVYVDVRRPKRVLDTDEIEFPEEPPVMTDLADVDLAEVEVAEIYDEKVA